MCIILRVPLSLNWPHFESSVATCGERLPVLLASTCGWWCFHRPLQGAFPVAAKCWGNNAHALCLT